MQIAILEQVGITSFVTFLYTPSKSSIHHAVDSQEQSRGYKTLPDICSSVASCLFLAQSAYNSADSECLWNSCAVTSDCK